MHIEPGIVDGAKMALACATAAVAVGYTLKLAADDLEQHNVPSLVLRTVFSSVGAYVFLQVLPNFPAGVSEVHFILGTTLFLLMGPAAAAFGLVLGLLMQGTLFAPSDLPMFLVNMTTLLFPLFGVHMLAGRTVPKAAAYVDLGYTQVLRMSAVYQGGVVACVAFWAIYGQGISAEVLQSVLAFGGAYLLVILVEPLVDLTVLAGARTLNSMQGSGFFANRLHDAG